MEKPFEIYNNFNELEFLYDSNSKDIFGDITKNRFGENLLLAIIETVTIGDKTSIGTSQYLSYKPKEYILNTIHKDYIKIIEAIENSSIGTPVKYYNWYKRDKYFYVMGSNDLEFKEKIYLLNSEIVPQTNHPNSEEYIPEYDDEISDDTIKTSLENYSKLLLKTEWFRAIPNFFILAKPISIKDDSELYIPLGNIYLIIGTKEKVDLNTFKKYVNHLKAVWFNQFGHKILKEYSEKKRSDEYKPKHILHNNLGTKLKAELFKVRGNPKSLNDFYYSTFDLDGNNECIDENLLYSSSEFIMHIIKSVNSFTNLSSEIHSYFDSKKDENNILTKNKSGLKKHTEINKKSISYFLQLLSKRRLALFLLYVCDYTEEQTHSIVTFGEKTGTTANKSVEIYLRDNLLIYPDKSYNFDLLADREVLFLKRTFAEIKKKFPNFHTIYETQLLLKS